MNVIKEYVDYLKDNPKRYWFRRKIWGWGWVPATWEGWLVLAWFVAVIVWNFFRIDSASHSVSDTLINYIPQTALALLVLVFVCIWTGEPPKWMWGFPKKDSSDNESK